MKLGPRIPKRIQLSRHKGYRKPAGAIVVARPSKWGNPFTLANCRAAGYRGTDAEIALRCVEAFRVWLGPYWRENWDSLESEARRTWMLEHIRDLRGHDLACWCGEGPCHADVLLELANSPKGDTP